MHNKYLVADPWKIIEDRWYPDRHQGAESIFSIGNGRMGQRANFEENYSGEHLQGSYIGGVYYPDKTRVGWWKNGYPEYFAKVLNSVNWIGIEIVVDGVKIDLAKCKVMEFYRELNMQEGTLLRTARIEIAPGKIINIASRRIISMVRKETGAISYSVTPIDFNARISFKPYLDFDVSNSDSNYDEKFWDRISENVGTQKAVISARTKKTKFSVSAAMRFNIFEGEEHLPIYPEQEKRDMYAANSFEITASANTVYTLYKYAAITSSLNFTPKDLEKKADHIASEAMRSGFEKLLAEHTGWWHDFWRQSDIQIEGDDEAQQGIRFNIFQLIQTYTGDDPRLNIGPKGFTGEKYGGSTYWDTEAYCLPFYMASSGKEVARNLLMYRYKHLQKAIDNAKLLGFTNGAALYPMVTMNGEECHNEWEITFEEIHRNGAIAFAIFNYTRYFGDKEYLHNYGLEVLIGIARFWSQRINWSEAKQQFVMLGVTGPNEYENNVNNNWYTNYLARWCLKYTIEALEDTRANSPASYNDITKRASFDEEETHRWKEIIDNIFLPEDEKLGVILQQENYLDKKQQTADELDPSERPINQHWSWDRILRSCFIKQADVLQGMYLFEDHFDKHTLEANFDFYEPRTVHESSLSPCVHVVLACSLGKMDKAYELYLRTSRLDLDDYNHEVDEGLHITSMAGTWLSVVEGFGGMRVKDNTLHFNPRIPAAWKALQFTVRFRDSIIEVRLTNDGHHIKLIEGPPVDLKVAGENVELQTA